MASKPSSLALPVLLEAISGSCEMLETTTAMLIARLQSVLPPPNTEWPDAASVHAASVHPRKGNFLARELQSTADRIQCVQATLVRVTDALLLGDGTTAPATAAAADNSMTDGDRTFAAALCAPEAEKTV